MSELTPVSPAKLRRHGVSRVELEALQLLTHRPGEPYDQYVRRIAAAPGPAGQLARTVKLADLDDHLAHASIPSGAPPYAWARRRLLTSRDLGAHPAPSSDPKTTASGQGHRGTVRVRQSPTARSSESPYDSA